MLSTVAQATKLPRGMRGSSNEPTAAERDALLVAVARSGDRAAFARLFRYYAPRLKAWLLQKGGDPVLAEDLAQETMLIVWQKAALFDAARGSTSAWIFTIARNLWVDALRQERHPGELMPDLLTATEPPLADTAAAGEQEADRVRAALSRLPPAQARVVQEAFFGDNAHAGIEKTLNIPLGTVKSRLRLAMMRLRTMLGDLQ
jgi:RNA polymerase sigma-70 factor, ECF subfamily